MVATRQMAGHVTRPRRYRSRSSWGSDYASNRFKTSDICSIFANPYVVPPPSRGVARIGGSVRLHWLSASPVVGRGSCALVPQHAEGAGFPRPVAGTWFAELFRPSSQTTIYRHGPSSSRSGRGLSAARLITSPPLLSSSRESRSSPHIN